VLWKCNYELNLHYCRATKYLVLLLTRISIKYHEPLFIISLVMKHRNCVLSTPHRIAICGLPDITSQMVRFSQKNWLNMKYVFWCSLQLLSEIFIIPKIIHDWTWNMCLMFSTTFVWNIYYSKNNSARYYHTFTHVF